MINGEKVEAEVVDDKAENGEASEDGEASEEKKEKTIYYVTDEKQQSQYINMFKAAKMDAVMLTERIDQPFISQLEAKNEGIHFAVFIYSGLGSLVGIGLSYFQTLWQRHIFAVQILKEDIVCHLLAELLIL